MCFHREDNVNCGKIYLYWDPDGEFCSAQTKEDACHTITNYSTVDRDIRGRPGGMGNDGTPCPKPGHCFECNFLGYHKNDEFPTKGKKAGKAKK